MEAQIGSDVFISSLPLTAVEHQSHGTGASASSFLFPPLYFPSTAVLESQAATDIKEATSLDKLPHLVIGLKGKQGACFCEATPGVGGGVRDHGRFQLVSASESPNTQIRLSKYSQCSWFLCSFFFFKTVNDRSRKWLGLFFFAFSDPWGVFLQAALVLRMGLQPAQGSGSARQVEPDPRQHGHLSYTLPPTG